MSWRGESTGPILTGWFSVTSQSPRQSTCIDAGGRPEWEVELAGHCSTSCRTRSLTSNSSKITNRYYRILWRLQILLGGCDRLKRLDRVSTFMDFTLYCVIVRSPDWLIRLKTWSISRSIDWLSGWRIDWLIQREFCSFLNLFSGEFDTVWRHHTNSSRRHSFTHRIHEA